jgi:ribonuclease P protein component
LIDSISDRAVFDRLRAEGRRRSDGPLTVMALRDPELAPPRIAFALPRKVGNAVVRNQFRRRSRQVLRTAGQTGRLAPGAYLVVARPGVAELTFDQLTGSLLRLAGVTSGGPEA